MPARRRVANLVTEVVNGVSHAALGLTGSAVTAWLALAQSSWCRVPGLRLAGRAVVSAGRAGDRYTTGARSSQHAYSVFRPGAVLGCVLGGVGIDEALLAHVHVHALAAQEANQAHPVFFGEFDRQ